MSNRLKKLRKEKELTQADLAKVLNTNQSQYGKYENGKTNLSIENAKILAEYFGVSTPYLLGLDDDSCIDGSKNMTPFQSLVRDRGLSLKEISEATGIAYPTLSGYNQGIRTPKKKNAKILAEYFGVSIPYLLGIDDNPVLVNPGSTKEIFKGFAKVLQGKSTIENKITQWTPFGEDLAIILKELNQSEALSDYIDFLASKKDFNPILVKAIKEFIADEKQGLIPFLINKSGAEDSPYHYVWQAWEKTPEYQERMAEKRNK